MPLYGPSTATATVAANTNSVAITGMDLTAIVQQGMTINFGARDRAIGDAWVINTVAPNGTNGGTLTLAGSVPGGFSNAPFLIDTRGFLGTDSSYAAAVSLKLLATLANLLGTATNLFAGSRQLVLDKVASTAIGRIAFAIAGRTWGDVAQRSLTYTPTGGQAVNVETMAVRAFPDGATPTDALLVDLTNGTGDLRAGSATMVSAATVDFSSAPVKKVAITGGATITSFGPGRHLERLGHILDGGATLTHNATSLILPGGANIVTRPGDTFHATSDGSGNWRVRDYTRASGLPLLTPFRGAGYTALSTSQYVAPTDYGRAFSWAVADGFVGLPLGSAVYPGWWCQIRLTGNPVGYGRSLITTPSFTDAFLFNGRAQAVDTNGTTRGFVVIGGNEEFRFMWTGAEWVIERVQSPTAGHFSFVRFGTGGYAATPTAFTAITAAGTSGTNTAAGAAFNLGFYAPCDGLYRLQGRTRFFNDASGTYAGAFAIASTSVNDADNFDGAPYRSYEPGEYEDVIARCTKRLYFGQPVASYKSATDTALKSAGVYEIFAAELVSRG
ncbi:hypothetical protein ASF33_09925 [Methylobacterium sp. Leaf92]|nr:hypothetical protein ASF33_09925 [Methylobacterium sp. Leaf92]